MARPRYYVLGPNREVVPTDDVMTWATQLEDSEARRVAYTKLLAGRISTVFLGLDHADNGPPKIFETMVMPSDDEPYVAARASTWAQAELDHINEVEKFDAYQPKQDMKS